MPNNSKKKKSKKIRATFSHPGGTILRMFEDGTMSIDVKGKLTIVSKRGLNGNSKN